MTRWPAAPTRPATSDDVQLEAAAVREGLALAWRDDLVLLRVGGEAARAFLQRVLATDLRSLELGQAAPAVLLTPKARVVSTLTVIAVEAGVLCAVPRVSADTLYEQLERYAITDDISLEALPLCALGLYGPRLAGEGAFAPLSQIAPYATAEIDVAGKRVLALGDDVLGERGVLLWLGNQDAERLWQSVTSEGSVLPVSWQALELCRIEAGTPRMGAELGEEVMILEAGQLATVSFSKGCYPGQEPVCRVQNRGQVSWRLVGLRVEGHDVPAVAGSLARDEREASIHVTSAAWSPRAGAVLCLAYAHRRVLEAGGPVTLADGRPAEVMSLPQLPVAIKPRSCPTYESGDDPAPPS